MEGAPEFVIDILSESTRKYDHGSEKDPYLAHGVREYWAVDPDRRVVHVFRPSEEESTPMSGRLTSTAVGGFWIDIAWLWQ